MRDNDEISAGFETLMRQAPMTAALYMHEAKKEIDALFGDGYAAENPTLVAGFIQAAATDLLASSVGLSSQKLRDAIAGLADVLRDK